jgi:murein DD-endopeptidase MepM/ murein hydrolase activator NlpD
MPRWPFLALAPALALSVFPAAAAAQTGGVAAPEDDPPVPTRFSVAPRTFQPGQAPVRFTYRIDGPRRPVRVRIDLVPARTRRPAARLELGQRPTGRTLVYAWSPAAGTLTAGSYAVGLHAVDRAGRPLRRTARASGTARVRVVVPPPPAPSGPGVFPVQGAWSLGGPEARFGAPRDGHVHQGQDIPAAEGTPVVSPQAGAVVVRAYQAAGAGNYLVVRAVSGRDFVFMHLFTGSELVAPSDPVAAGQPIAQVGQTGDADGPHLHFEIWPGGWRTTPASQPIDPLPDLLAWAGLAVPPAAPPPAR